MGPSMSMMPEFPGTTSQRSGRGTLDNKLDAPLVAQISDPKEENEKEEKESTNVLAAELTAKLEVEKMMSKHLGDDVVAELLSDGYKDRGCFQWIVRHPYFEWATFI